MILFSHPTGNANARAAVNAFNKNKLLQRFYTSIACYPKNIFGVLSRFRPFSEFRRRNFNPELHSLTTLAPWKELGRILFVKLGWKSLVKHEKGCFSVDSVYTSLDKVVASELNKFRNTNVKGVYSYEDGAINTFRNAKKKKILCLYDLPIGYWKAAKDLMEVEKARWPEWAPTLVGLSDSNKKLKAKDEELALADYIFVASSFTANTLKKYESTLPPVKIIPYGFPDVGPERLYTYHLKKRKLKLLFVGGLSQRKGIADLFAVYNQLKDEVELTVVGAKSTESCEILDQSLKTCTWIPSLSHDKVLDVMRKADVLVFPSLFEGFGLVITEAMSQGTPVLTTERTAGPDIIEHDENGWLVPAGSVGQLTETIVDLIRNPEKIAKAGKSARQTARNRPWEVYGAELASSIKDLLP